jgi:hypothetical protein
VIVIGADDDVRRQSAFESADFLADALSMPIPLREKSDWNRGSAPTPQCLEVRDFCPNLRVVILKRMEPVN